VLTFLGLSVLLILTPGPNQALLTGRVLSGGRRAGFAAVRGLAAGMAVHVAAATAGLSALLASSAQVFGAVKLLGGLYLLWLGIAAIRRARLPAAKGAPPRGEPAAVEPPRGERARGGAVPGGSPFRDGLLSMTLNPKVGVYFIAVVPQFVAPGPGASVRVALLLVVYGGLCLVFWTAFVVGLHHARELVRRPRVRAWTERVTGAALIGLGARLAA
jgi:threonine/homoserine/homoserine lactone efflux protein